MEYPYNLATNVHKIHILSFQWTLYQYDQSSLHTSFTGSEQLGGTSFDNEPPEPELSILEAFWVLRNENYLVFLDAENLALWVFDALISNTGSISHEPKDISQVINDHRLQAVASSTFASEQLDRTFDFSSTNIHHSDDDVRALDTSNPFPNFSSQEQDGQANTIYAAFISAFRLSFLKNLAEKGEWVELGTDSCIRFSEDFRLSSTSFDPLLENLERSVQWLRLDVRWSPSGMLMVSGDLRNDLRISTLSNELSNRNSVGKTGMDVGHPVTISPFGSQYVLAGLEEYGPGSGRTSASKRSAITLLKRMGIKITSNTVWARLRRPLEYSGGQNSFRIQSFSERWWPAFLCFVPILSGSTSSAEVLERIADGTFVDPLVKAQQWFLDRDKREAAIEAERKAKDAVKAEESRVAESGVGSQAQNMTALNQAGRVDQYLSAQEASSIYPTPPDGLIPHIQNSLHQDATVASVAEGQSVVADDHEATAAGSIENNHPETDMSVGKLEAEEKQDLFEDLDTDMFEANGLTEDDFNFFDEPGEKDDIETHPEHPNPVLVSSNWSSIEDGHLDDAIALPVHEDLDDISMKGQEGSDMVLQNTNVTMSCDIVSLAIAKPATEEHHAITPEYESIHTMQLHKDEIDSEALLESKGELMNIDSVAQHSSYSVVALRSGFQDFDEKYRKDGKYATSFPEPSMDSGPGKHQPELDRKLPNLGSLTVSSKDIDETDDSSSSSGSINRWHYDGGLTPSPDKTHPKASIEANHSPSKKRKREPSVVVEGLASPAISADLPDAPSESSERELFDLEQDFSGYDTDTDLFNFGENHASGHGFTFYGNNQDFIQIAQLVADQKVLQNGLIRHTFNDVEYPSFLETWKSSSDIVQAILLENFSDVRQCDLESFLELGSSRSLSEEDGGRRQQTTAFPDDRKVQNDQIQKVNAPYINVRRGETAMDMADTALYFWEELSLAPAQEGKNVMAFCIYPENDTIRDAVSLFLTTMEVSYQSCKFGRHQRGSGLRRYQEGLVSVPISGASPESVFESLEEACAGLGTDLPLEEADGMNYVIYMVNPFNNDAALPHLSSAFLQLFSTYVSSMKRTEETVPRDLVLQVIPMSFLADCHCLTIPPPKAYTELAFEVYSRCSPAPRDTVQSPFTSTSAIRLAKPIPKTINFQLTSQPPHISLSADSCIHLAYCWDNESQWLACSWSDNLGTLQWSTVYCLQDPKPDYWTMFSLTVEEILDTTKDMIEPNSIPWKLYIVKDRALHQQELEAWRLHSSSSTFQQYFRVTMLSIDSSPPLSFPPHQSASGNNTFPLAPSSTLDNQTSPAASTPFDQVNTPDHHSSPMNTQTQTPNRNTTHTSPATPSASTGFTDPDPAARLVDVVSETWSMISPNNPIPDPYLPTPLLAPVLLSGYLLKRAGADDEDGLLPLGVNLVSTDLKTGNDEAGVSQGNEKVLRDVLGMYSDLSSLARMRGIEEWKGGVLPWHVAAARKARGAVGGCMRWGARRK